MSVLRESVLINLTGKLFPPNGYLRKVEIQVINLASNREKKRNCLQAGTLQVNDSILGELANEHVQMTPFLACQVRSSDYFFV